MRKIVLLGIIWAWCLSPAWAVIVDRIVAVVNDDVITLTELDETAAPLYQRYLPQIKDPVERERAIQEIRKKVLRQMIDNLLVSQEASKREIKVSEEEVDHFIENVKRQNHLTDEQFLKFLADMGLSLEEYRQKAEEQIKRIKLIQSQVRGRLVITDEEIAAYYQEHYPQEVKTKYKLAAIIIRGPGAKEKIEEAYQRLKAGEDFVKVAREYSSLPGSGEGLGTFSLEELSPEVRKVVQKLRPGEISPPVKVMGSWQIYKLLEVHQEGTASLEKLRPEIEQRLQQERVDQLFQKWLKDLREKSYIRILL